MNLSELAYRSLAPMFIYATHAGVKRPQPSLLFMVQARFTLPRRSFRVAALIFDLSGSSRTGLSDCNALMRTIEPTRSGTYRERFLGFKNSQTIVFIGLHTRSFLKVSASFKRGRAFGLFIAPGQPARNGRLPGRVEAFLRGIRRPELTKK